MKSTPTHEQFDEAFSKSHELDPSPDSWGLFAYSDAPPNVCGSGLGSFQWFNTKADMICFVRDFMAWWNPAPSSMEPEEIAQRVQAIIADAGDQPDVAELRHQLNDFMRNMWHIESWGQFKEFLASNDEFPKKVRQSFLEDLDESECSTAQGMVPESQLKEFAEYLREYGV